MIKKFAVSLDIEVLTAQLMKAFDRSRDDCSEVVSRSIEIFNQLVDILGDRLDEAAARGTSVQMKESTASIIAHFIWRNTMSKDQQTQKSIETIARIVNLAEAASRKKLS